MAIGQDETRPDPDALLRQAVAEEGHRHRGKLKVFFGASAGVGKTYAMLKSARQQREQGVDIVAGVVETHGRQETAELLEGLEVLPLREVHYRGHKLREFDLDAALARRPAVLLVDELAHTNVPGSRHPKRWQDIDELLAQGIDVHTCLNVQHLESLNDVVGGITGIVVRETVPDRFFDSADEVVLVDLPADELLQRLKEGKVYLEGQAERAIRNFFRKGNLVALREMALRRTADRVNDDVHTYRREPGRDRVWQTRERLLACVGPAPGSDHVLRSAGRLAAALNAEWHTLFIETPAIQQMPDNARQTILARLKLAEDMGSATSSIANADVAATLVAFARKHNITKIVLGRTRHRWLPLRARADLPQRIAALAPDIEIVLVSQERSPGERPARPAPPLTAWRRRMRGALSAAGVCAAISLATLPLHGRFQLTNIAMMYLLGVLLVAMRFGRSPAIIAALLNVLAFDLLFVPPRYSFAVADAEYLVTFAVMLVVGLLTAQVTAGFHFQSRVAHQREERVQEMYHSARELSGALTADQIVDIARRAIQTMLGTRAAVLVPDMNDRLAAAPDAGLAELDLGIAQWCLDRGAPAGAGTDTLPGSAVFYLPLKAPMRVRGVLAIALKAPFQPEQRRQVEALGALLAIALERVHFVSVAQETLVKIESERLRESLLAALSHDLRTPLTALHGLAEALAQQPERLAPDQAEAVEAIRVQSLGMVRLVSNLLAMARLESGQTPLRPDWIALEELAGSACRVLGSVLGKHTVRIDIPAEFPLLFGDAVLLERVLCNLLENAAKYVPAGGLIGLTARAVDGTAEIEVWDNGPGLPPGREAAIFAKFVRGRPESDTTGVGLGLAISKAIVEAHRGTIHAANRVEGGARFIVRLPLREMPALEAEPELLEPAS